MLGDTAIVVNPNDDRYKDVIGKKVILPIVGRELPPLPKSISTYSSANIGNSRPTIGNITFLPITSL
jgi:hypothetical protein